MGSFLEEMGVFLKYIVPYKVKKMENYLPIFWYLFYHVLQLLFGRYILYIHLFREPSLSMYSNSRVPYVQIILLENNKSLWNITKKIP